MIKCVKIGKVWYDKPFEKEDIDSILEEIREHIETEEFVIIASDYETAHNIIDNE